MMLDRAGYKCEITGNSTMPLEAMHKFHLRDSEYNELYNGWIGERLTHLTHHFMFANDSSLLGMYTQPNLYAIKSLYARTAPIMVNSGRCLEAH